MPKRVTIKKPTLQKKERGNVDESSIFPRIEHVYTDKSGWLMRRMKFINVPDEYHIKEDTEVGIRVLVARWPDNYKCYFRAYHKPKTIGFIDGGITIFNAIDGRLEHHYMDSVVIHPKGDIKKENKAHINVTGHRAGTKAAERAERKLERAAKKRAKVEAREARIKAREDKKKAKEEKRLAKVHAREEKIRLKEERKAKRLAKKLRKERKKAKLLKEKESKRKKRKTKKSR